MSRKPSPHLVLTPVLPSARGVSFGMAGTAESQLASGGGSSGWQLVDRPLQKTLTQWYGASTKTLSLSLILDGDGESVEPQLARVDSWLYPAPNSLQPAVLAVAGPVSRQVKALYWYLADMKVDDDKAIRSVRTADRTQAMVELSLGEYVPAIANVLTQLSPAAAAAASQGILTTSPSTRTHTVKTNETLATIAAGVLGNQGLWPQIASLNGIRDPRSVTAGQVLRLP